VINLNYYDIIVCHLNMHQHIFIVLKCIFKFFRGLTFKMSKMLLIIK